MQKNKCVFLDRDGVLNEDLGDYLYKLDELVIPSGVPEALMMLKNEGFLLIVITNQAGIAKGLYGPAEVYAIHEYMQQVSGNVLDDIYFSPHHPLFSGMSLSRKPDSLLIEKAIAKYNIDPAQSWMIGDRERDMQAGKKMGLSTIHILSGAERLAGDFAAENLWSAVSIILRQKN